jgi:hypothetical protein
MFVLGCVEAQAAEEFSPTEVIKKALNAHGGTKALTRLLRTYSQYRVVLKDKEGNENGILTEDFWQQLPDTCKRIIKASSESERGQEIQVMREGRAWVVQKGEVLQERGWVVQKDKKRDAKVEEFDRLQRKLYVNYITLFFPLLEDPSFKLSALPAKTIDGKVNRGIKVSHLKYPDFSLFFDKETNLLTSVVYQSSPADKTDQSATMYFSDYKMINSVMVAMTRRMILSRGQADIRCIKFETLETFPEDVFAKPR